MEKKQHFVLVHGSCHGAWCWYKLVSLLKTAGHQVTALDLGASGVHPQQLEEISSISDYLQPLMDFLASLPEPDKVVLVGHSYAGLCISLAMERFPHKVSVAVFIAAYMPHHTSPPGNLIQEYFKRTTVESVMDCQFTFDNGHDKPPTTVLFGPNFMEAKAYSHCQLELQKNQLLVRYKVYAGFGVGQNVGQTEWTFLGGFDHGEFINRRKFRVGGSVFIELEEDEVMTPEFQRYMVENSPPKEVKVIRGADHMAMLSKPNELCLLLQDIIHKLC